MQNTSEKGRVTMMKTREMKVMVELIGPGPCGDTAKVLRMKMTNQIITLHIKDQILEGTYQFSSVQHHFRTVETQKTFH